MTFIKSFRFILLFLSFSSFSQQLLINEISQGTGSREYVEFIVAGSPTCQTPIPCMDLRGVLIDDNDGYFAPGSGEGIAPGAVRFADNAFWSCIPQGTMIVIYNESSKNPAIPADDVSMSDGNCRLIIPINSMLFEGQGVGPTSGGAGYPPSGSWIAGGGEWSQVAMSNSNDSFQIRNSISSPTPTHAVSWGTNNNNTIITFPSAGGNVFSMTNNVDDDAFLQSNWTLGAVGTNETPGAANSTENDAWIGGMNPQCGMSNAIQLTVSSTPTGCGTSCTGTASVNITGGTSPYTVSWSNGATSTSISNLCAATYTVVVTDDAGCESTEQVVISNSTSTLNVQLTSNDESCLGVCDGSIVSTVTGGTAPLTYSWSSGETTPNLTDVCASGYSLTVTDDNGCSVTENATVNPGPTTQDATINTTGPFSTDDNPVQFNANSSGGVWSADCGTCITAGGVFDPQSVTEGVYEICYTVGSGSCTDNDCQTITVTEGCSPQFTSETVSVCPETTFDYNGQQYTQPGTYPTAYTDVNNCDSTHTLILEHFNVIPQSDVFTICSGDSVQVAGTWYNYTETITENTTDSNGCPVTNSTYIYVEDCTLEEYNVFIPNVFTPNGDEVNNVFEISITGGMLESGFIVNRWGNVIHEFHESDLVWDGTSKGVNVQDGVYTYVVKIRAAGSATLDLYHGFVTLIR